MVPTFESGFVLDTSDGKQIYGVLHGSAESTQSVAILVHGLTGFMDEHLHLVTARYLVSQGIAAIRFNQYTDDSGGRRFHETTLHLHIEDTRDVVTFARKLGFERVALIGHSLGGPISILACNELVQGLVLWDPTGAPSERIRDWETRDSSGTFSYLDWGMRIILGQGWIQDAKNFPDPFERLAQLTIPVKIIAAENGGKIDYSERYGSKLKVPCRLTVIPGAGHTFTEFDAAESLARTTAEWLQAVFAE